MHTKVWAQFVQFPFDVRLTTDRIQLRIARSELGLDLIPFLS